MYSRYNNYNSPLQKVQRFVTQTGAPVTVTLIALNVISFFWSGIAPASSPAYWLGFNSLHWMQYPWTLLTWPLAGGGHPINVLFSCLWAFWMCGSLERSWGLKTFLGFFFGCAALMAVSVWIGGILLGFPSIPLAGLYFAIAPATVAWCVVNSRESICFYGGLCRIPAPVLLALTLVFVWYELGAGAMGLFGLVACGTAYLYARYGRSMWRGYAPARSKTPPPLRMYDEDRVPARSGLSGWFRAKQEQRKLEKLWKNSTKDDDKR